jgi:hypothetical protein
MKIDCEYFRALIKDVIDENPMACRAVFSVCEIDFTDEVETLAVTLGSRSVLKVNLNFLNQHCKTESHVKAVLLHEFLHILLGHALKFEKMTTSLNIALDAVINAIIHRKFGEEYSSLMSSYYGNEEGVISLLRPMEESTRLQTTISLLNGKPVEALAEIHAGLYNGSVLSEDVFSIAEEIAKRGEGITMLNGKPTLWGGGGFESQEEWEVWKASEGGNHLRRHLGSFNGTGVFRDKGIFKPQILSGRVRQSEIPATWKRETIPVLKKLLTRDCRSQVNEDIPRTFHEPILNGGDRRGCLKSIWSPLIPDIEWRTMCRRPGGSVQVYLDVSGSMAPFLNALIGLLWGFYGYVKKPLWAFSTEVREARIVEGRLSAKTSGGTSLACVWEHLERTRPQKALIVTDGFVESDARGFRGEALVEALIPHDGHSTILKNVYKIPTTRLGPLTE